MASSSGPMELKREIAAQKKVLFSQLRGEATALNAVKVKRNDMGVWEPSTRRGANVSREAFTRHGREIASLLSYFENLHSPVLDVISNDKFELKYQFYGDIDREAVLGSNTMTATIPVHWEKNDIDVYLYPGELDKLMSKARLAGAAREHIPNRDEVAKNTGWDRNAVRQFPDNRMHLMQGLLENMQAGQQKLTRLVKGFLILLEIVERGAVDFTIGDRAHIVYGPNEVVGAYERGGSAYVWNSKPSSTEHTAVILGMCRSYPPPQFGSHVYIPGDADIISEVSQGLPLDRNSAVTLTPSLVYSSILTYAMDTSCIGLIQEAQLIACSLHENRYFTNVGLPKVVSQYDLMVPAFIAQHSALETSITSKELSKSIGRVHQMLAMVIAKDVIGAAHMQSKRGFSAGTTIRSYLNGNSSTVLQMASQATGLSILNKTSRMRLFEKLDEDNYSDILNETIFEGLWLVRDGKIFVNNGPISHLLDGAKDRTDNDTSYNVLKEELILGNVTIEDRKMPDGAFSTSWVSACRQRPVSRQSRPKVWRSLTLTKDCNYGPDNDLKKQGRRVRSQRNRDTKTVSRTVPVTYALRSPPRSRESSDREVSMPKPVFKGRKVSIESEPPSYGRSSSPVTESDQQRESEEGLFAAEADVAAEEPISPMHSRGRSTLERIRSRMDDELVEKDLIDTLKNGKLGKSEREEWLSMIRGTVGVYPASKKGSMRGIVDLLREYGDVRADEKLSGNSKWKRLISNYDLGTRSGTSVSDMKQSGVNWEGEVTQENREGWKFIANSEPWKAFLFDHGVPDESTVFGSAARYTYARILSNIDCDVEGLGRFHKIFDNTSKNLVWPDKLDINAVRGMPSRDNMAWRRGDTSLGMRGMNSEDSQMLYLAAYYPDNVFDIDMLKRLCGEFNVPKDVREELSETYGLFQRQP